MSDRTEKLEATRADVLAHPIEEAIACTAAFAIMGEELMGQYESPDDIPEPLQGFLKDMVELVEIQLGD